MVLLFYLCAALVLYCIMEIHKEYNAAITKEKFCIRKRPR